MTGFERDGRYGCHERDPGRHELCVVVTEVFLAFGTERVNDLPTARSEPNFPGLDSGDRWSLCVQRWVEAVEAVENG